jgi:hypothetical protein
VNLKTVHVVVGTTGDFSDHTRWNVAAYTEKEMAELHAARANDWLREHRSHEDQVSSSAYPARAKDGNPFDALMSMDVITGANYAVEDVKIFVHLDEFLEHQPPPPCPPV